MARDPRIALDDMAVAIDLVPNSPRGETFLAYAASLTTIMGAPEASTIAASTWQAMVKLQT